MEVTLGFLAQLVGGQVLGDSETPITGAAPLPAACPGVITLVDRPERLPQAVRSGARAVLLPENVEPNGLPAIRVRDVHRAFEKIVSFFRPPRSRQKVGISPLAWIHPSAKLAEDVDVYPFATIAEDVEVGPGCVIHSGVHILAGCKIAENVTIFPNAVLYEDTIVGPRCIIHAGAIIGAYGFGYLPENGHHRLAPQLGNVILEADVEVGAGATIDRGTYGPTVIGEGTKIDNLVLVAHNCRIGRHNLICGQVGIAGSVTTGDYVVMAGRVGIRDHVRIGKGAVLGAMAGIMNDVPDGARVVGIPATPEREQKVKQAVLSKLPEMRLELKRLQAKIAELEARLSQVVSGRSESASSRD
ncbi:MAG: UDP-3-O-(3-hydroxymyristoyl)glucosamine N-acyltransferase [Thermoguttaceae bacterium]|nr:UDP-3-O-(3-hydroxymyristoyl)glucosamine N-acyltransferase [Thermoguttaceae bacterium]MDW8080191.1 UDP-3-O-(3-hydroxymyristoyl)glucosamine N-acyltransferase [Thermoguttaceae bacterium]